MSGSRFSPTFIQDFGQGNRSAENCIYGCSASVRFHSEEQLVFCRWHFLAFIVYMGVYYFPNCVKMAMDFISELSFNCNRGARLTGIDPCFAKLKPSPSVIYFVEEFVESTKEVIVINGRYIRDNLFDVNHTHPGRPGLKIHNTFRASKIPHRSLQSSYKVSGLRLLHAISFLGVAPRILRRPLRHCRPDPLC